MRKMLSFAVLGAILVSVLATAAMSQAKTSGERAKTLAVVISTRKLPKLGTVLVNSKGRTFTCSCQTSVRRSHASRVAR